MPKKVNGKWDFNDLKQYENLSQEEKEKLHEESLKRQQETEDYLQKIDPLNQRKRVR